jgi:glutamate---cysteine ligase / carboxylate-amine ligase
MRNRLDDTIALAALMKAIVAKSRKQRRRDVTFRGYPRRLIAENRWRASPTGFDGKLIDSAASLFRTACSRRAITSHFA